MHRSDLSGVETVRRQWAGLAGILTGMGLSSAMQTCLVVSMPSILGELGGKALYNWVFGAYMLASTITVPLFGKLADSLGRRRVYLAGLFAFAAGSVLCGLSSTMGMLVAGRAVMGIGAGAVTPAAIAMAGGLFGESGFSKAFGLAGIVQIASNLAGPVLGGFLTDVLSWRWGFFLFLPLELLGAILVLTGIPPATKGSGHDVAKGCRRDALRGLDWRGAVLLSSGLLCLVLGMQLGGWKYYLAGTALIIVAVLALGGAVILEGKRRDPLLPVWMFRHTGLRKTFLLIFLLGIINGSASTYLSLYYQYSFGMSASKAGILLVPMLASAGAASVVCGWVSKQKRSFIASCTWIAQGISFLCLFLAGRSGEVVSVLLTMPVGFGLGFLMPVFLGSSQELVGEESRASSGGMAQLSRNLGGTMGVTVLGIWISGTLPVSSGLEGIFISLSLIAFIAFFIPSPAGDSCRQDPREAEGKVGRHDTVV